MTPRRVSVRSGHWNPPNTHTNNLRPRQEHKDPKGRTRPMLALGQGLALKQSRENRPHQPLSAILSTKKADRGRELRGKETRGRWTDTSH